jgi:glycosyltransferase involved in cell wall biosynthesis
LKKILFIAAHRKDRAPNQRFRFEQYFDFLTEQGYHCELSPLITAQDDPLFYRPGHYLSKIRIGLKAWQKRFADTLRMNDYDIIFIAREAFMTGSVFFEKKFRSSKAKIIYDFDDAIWIDVISPGNKALAWLKDAGKTAKIIAMADLVFAGNQFLADYARRHNPNVVIIPTTIDTDHYRPAYRTDKKVITVGWSGSVSTLEHFKYALPALTRLKELYGSRIAIKVIGDGQYRNETLGITGIPWRYATELDDLREIDIGIMPLPDNEWTWGKCGLKGLQYMALEIPTVMSPVGVNREIIQHGINGYLASSTDEWVGHIARLIDHVDHRVQVGKAGRATVTAAYSVKSQQERYLGHMKALLS